MRRSGAVPPIDIPTFRAAGADPSSWIKPGDKPLTFRTTGQQRDVALMPINSIFDKRYNVYWQVSEVSACHETNASECWTGGASPPFFWPPPPNSAGQGPKTNAPP